MKGITVSFLLGIGLLFPNLKLNGQDMVTLVAKPFPSVRIQAGTGFHFMDFTCLNQWFRYYNYPLLPSGSGQGNIGIQWHISSKWKAGVQIHQGASGIQSKSGYRVQYRSGAMDISGGYALISRADFQCGLLGGLEFRQVEVNLERQMPSDGSGLKDLLTGGGSFANRNSGGILRNSARNVRGGVFVEYGSQQRIAYGLNMTGVTGSENRWEFNRQKMGDSPMMPLRGLRFEVYVGIRI
jgi:hypothetical protein